MNKEIHIKIESGYTKETARKLIQSIEEELLTVEPRLTIFEQFIRWLNK